MANAHLPQLLADAAGISRSEARRCISQGGVKVNGSVVEDCDQDLQLDDEVTLGRRQRFKVHGRSFDPEQAVETIRLGRG